MEQPTRGANKAVDSIQERFTQYAVNLRYEDLSAEAIHTAKARVIDTLGALIAGFFDEPCQIARAVAATYPNPAGATVIGTRIKTMPDLAAFANTTTARYVELNDIYHNPGSYGGHPSDVIMPVLAIAEYVHANGQDFITGVVLAYEVYCRMSDIFHGHGFDNTNFACLATAIAASKILKLSSGQLAHAISMAVVPNVILTQVRKNHLSMFKAAAAGQAGRAGVFAALLARAGMDGPHLPFEGKSGWCDHVAGERFSISEMGGNGVPFKILESSIKNRPANGSTIPCILAAEKVAPLRNIPEVEKVTVEVYQNALRYSGIDKHHWNPESKETADHSIPYGVAAALVDGTVTPRSYTAVHLWNPQLRALMQKVVVVENEEFTRIYKKPQQEHHARVTVTTRNGERLVGETGGDADDLAFPKSDAQIETKFRGLAEDVLGSKRITHIFELLWRLEDVKNASEIPAAFTFA